MKDINVQFCVQYYISQIDVDSGTWKLDFRVPDSNPTHHIAAQCSGSTSEQEKEQERETIFGIDLHSFVCVAMHYMWFLWFWSHLRMSK